MKILAFTLRHWQPEPQSVLEVQLSKVLHLGQEFVVHVGLDLVHWGGGSGFGDLAKNLWFEIVILN